jgi:hypothetical protein
METTQEAECGLDPRDFDTDIGNCLMNNDLEGPCLQT